MCMESKISLKLKKLLDVPFTLSFVLSFQILHFSDRVEMLCSDKAASFPFFAHSFLATVL